MNPEVEEVVPMAEEMMARIVTMFKKTFDPCVAIAQSSPEESQVRTSAGMHSLAVRRLNSLTQIEFLQEKMRQSMDNIVKRGCLAIDHALAAKSLTLADSERMKFEIVEKGQEFKTHIDWLCSEWTSSIPGRPGVPDQGQNR